MAESEPPPPAATPRRVVRDAAQQIADLERAVDSLNEHFRLLSGQPPSVERDAFLRRNLDLTIRASRLYCRLIRDSVQPDNGTAGTP